MDAHVAQLPAAPQPDDVNNAEMDELFTFVKHKNRVYVMIVVDRTTSCIMGWAVDQERSEETLISPLPNIQLLADNGASQYDLCSKEACCGGCRV